MIAKNFKSWLGVLSRARSVSVLFYKKNTYNNGRKA